VKKNGDELKLDAKRAKLYELKFSPKGALPFQHGALALGVLRDATSAVMRKSRN